ncbi:glutamate-5-semialdehyde dehydrogenase [Caloramator sp. CAR-1]|uniref:glutamate-5-semialdehyde dehydrogenase n=1 Tax=Caloramator sp. CAR-1 TaxID=3062777 RepID=UPI0026E143DE|nr:glutamate-5-semialdehyde dehydrogenase [Caloramator sp. CAR-1]MDO6354040.1 glutamate-5-semialdehyde dehydrogenase [Caloramator sp. CAR-1]
MDLRGLVLEKAIKAKLASRKIEKLDTDTKNKILVEMAKDLDENKELLINENKKDIENAKSQGLSNALIDRLMLNEKRISDMALGLRKIAELNDPIGEAIKMWKRPNGLEITQVRVPLGVIGIIYEARPNVTSDAVGLCLKSGNAVILKGGSEAINSNKIIVELLRKTLERLKQTPEIIQFIDVADREATFHLLKLNGYIDCLIPRGGHSLINFVLQNSSIPVIETGVGNCHVYVDYNADFNMAEKIIINAKVQRPAVCNAIENLLVHSSIAKEFMPIICGKLKDCGVEIRGCERTRKIVDYVLPANEEDYKTEYLDLVIAVKIVDSVEEAIEHINKYGTRHSEAIITNDYSNARKFQREIDAAVVYVNASTRFTDGFEFGFGAEIGISTQKLHVRGPMGLEALTSIKYVVNGSGQIRL